MNLKNIFAKLKDNKGEIGDSFIIVIAIFIGGILMFIFPLMTMADKTDETTALAIQTATTDYTTEIRTTGYISQESYDNFILTLAATGNSYNVDITVMRLDSNPAKKNSGDTTTIGDNIYYTMYTTQVLQAMPLSLTEGDFVSVKVQNTNETIANQLRNFMYKVTGKSNGSIVGESSGMVTKTHTN